MIKYIMKRLALMLVTFFVIVSVVYIGTRMAQLAIWSKPHPIIDDIKIAYEMYKVYLHNIFYDGDFGESVMGLDVMQTMLERIPVSMRISFSALLFYLPFGVLLGVLSAYYKDTLFDKMIANITMIFSSIPSYIVMFFFIMFFGYKLGWFPAIYDPNPDNLWELIMVLAMPVAALTIVPLATTIRFMRAELYEEMDKEYILLLRTKGLTRWQCMTRHAVRNCITPVIQDIAFTFGIMLTMAFIIEMTYNVHGIAYLFYQSMIVPSIDGNYLSIDTNVAVAVSGFYVAVLLFVAFFSDILLAFTDPRVNIKGKKA